MIQVQITDTETGDVNTVELTGDEYLIVFSGTAEFKNEVIHRRRDGTQTHVITLGGIR